MNWRLTMTTETTFSSEIMREMGDIIFTGLITRSRFTELALKYLYLHPKASNVITNEKLLVISETDIVSGTIGAIRRLKQLIAFFNTDAKNTFSVNECYQVYLTRNEDQLEIYPYKEYRAKRSRDRLSRIENHLPKIAYEIEDEMFLNSIENRYAMENVRHVVKLLSMLRMSLPTVKSPLLMQKFMLEIGKNSETNDEEDDFED